MSFRYSLQPLLRLRVSHERLEQARLFAIAAMLVRVREEIAAAAREEAAARNARREMLSRGIAAAEIQIGVSADLARARRNRELFERLAALERQHAKQTHAYRLARRRRELLEKLRERKLREYRREEDRKAQQTIDDLYLLMRAASIERE